MLNEPTKKKLIVVVEDEEVLANLLSNKVQEAGFDVRLARDGAMGLELIKSLRPDLVLLDMLLPKMSGVDILENLSKEKIIPTLPIIVISNSGQPVEIERVLELGVKDYLIKINFDLNEVMAKVKNVFTADDNKNKISADKVPSPLNKATPTILIVEDDTLIIKLLEKKFIQKNFKACKAMDAQQAYEILKTQKIDLILLDIILPGMDGITFLKELKENDNYKNIPVIIISNLGQLEEVDKGRNAGANDYIIKASASPVDIVTKVEALLNKLNN